MTIETDITIAASGPITLTASNGEQFTLNDGDEWIEHGDGHIEIVRNAK